MQEEGIPPREASWIEDSQEERDHEALGDDGEEYQQDELDTMWTEKEELWCGVSKWSSPTSGEMWLWKSSYMTALL